MKAFTTLATAAALAFGVASASQAAVFASFTPDKQTADYNWVKSGTLGGTLTTLGSYAPPPVSGPTCPTSTCAAVHFSYLDTTTSTLAFIPTSFQLNASVSPGIAATQSGGIWTQKNLNGGFSFIYWDSSFAKGSTQTYGGLTLTNGVSNLLSGTFTDARISGQSGSGAMNLSMGGGGSASYTSDFELFLGKATGSEEFAFNLLSATPHFGATAGQSLNSFKANGGGNFSFQTVPEPATWGLMIVGFAGVGGMVRNRRRALVTA
jgi:hypothetical protein